MLKMIIADDESIVRNGLKNIIPWNDFGIEIIATAKNGKEALKLSQELKPDILFTDIRMPFLDGIEVAQKLKEEGCQTRIIILSGIEDFNYARRAVDINAESYILKPVKIDKLKEVIQNVVTDIINERERENSLIKLKKQIKKNQPVIKENLLRNLLVGASLKKEDLQEKLDYLNIPINTTGNFQVAVISIDEVDKNIFADTEEDNYLLHFSILNIIREILSRYNKSGITSVIQEKEYAIIFIVNKYSNYEEICGKILETINDKLKVSLTIGIGQLVNDIINIKKSYQGATTALQYKFYTGVNSIIFIGDIELKENSLEISNLYDIEDNLMTSMKLGNIEDVEKTINNLFNYLLSQKKLSINYIQSIGAELFFTANRIFNELDENIDIIIKDKSNIINMIYNASTINKLRDIISNLFIKLTEYFNEKHNKKNSKIVEEIKEVIAKKFHENITMQMLSEKVHLTPNYISLLFKKETGETISEYTTKQRIETAKELLRETDFKVLEIAEMVGYDNPHYFSRVFKKCAGMQPSKYRDYSH